MGHNQMRTEPMAVIAKTTQEKAPIDSRATTLTQDVDSHTPTTPVAFVAAPRVRQVEPVVNPSLAANPVAHPRENSNGNKLRLVYTVLLGAAASLALIGVVLQNEPVDAGSPDAPPPAVLEQLGN